MPTTQKATQIEVLRDSFTRSQLAVIADYRGLSVSQLQTLRGTLRQSGAEFTVAKNTLTRIASDAAGITIPAEFLEGPTAIMFAFDDVVAPTKALTDFVRSSRILTLKVGVMEGQTLNTSQLEALASMPPREELLGKLVNLLASPMTRTAGVLSGPSRSLAYVLNARIEQLGGTAEAEAAD